MIEVCSIMPYPWLSTHDDLNKMHLALAPQIIQYDVYRKHFRTMAEFRNHYVIVDNGAYEGNVVELGTLHAAAMMVCANEIVVPDAMRDREKTLALYKEFAKHELSTLYNHMVVLQGSDARDCVEMYEDLKSIWYKTPRLCARATIALPKWLRGSRVDAVCALVDRIAVPPVKGIRTPMIHLLGYGHHNDCKLPKWAASHVRSMDTSMPACATLKGETPRSDMPAHSSVQFKDFFEIPLPSKTEQVLYMSHYSNLIRQMNTHEM